MHTLKLLRPAVGLLLAAVGPFSATSATPVAAADCLSGEWESVSYRSAVEAVLGPTYAVQDLSGTSHLWLRPDNTFAVVAEGLHISATKGTHQVSLSFSGREAGGYRQEVPGQFVLPEIVVEASASDIVVDGTHVSGPVDISSLFLWTPPSVVGSTPTDPGHFVSSDNPDAVAMPEFTYTCDADHLVLQQFHARLEAPPITYQRVGEALPIPADAYTGGATDGAGSAAMGSDISTDAAPGDGGS